MDPRWRGPPGNAGRPQVAPDVAACFVEGALPAAGVGGKGTREAVTGAVTEAAKEAVKEAVKEAATEAATAAATEAATEATPRLTPAAGVGPRGNDADAEGLELGEDLPRDVAAAEEGERRAAAAPAEAEERVGPAVVAAEATAPDSKSTDDNTDDPPRDGAGQTPPCACGAGRECAKAGGGAGVTRPAAENVTERQPAMATAAPGARECKSESDHRAHARVDTGGGWAQAGASVDGWAQAPSAVGRLGSGTVGGWAQAGASVDADAADVPGQLWPAGGGLQRMQQAETDEAVHAAAAGQESEMHSNAVAASEVLQLY